MWVCFPKGNRAIPFCLLDGSGSNWGFEQANKWRWFFTALDRADKIINLPWGKRHCAHTDKIHWTPASKVTLRVLMKLFFRSSNWRSDEFQVSFWTTSYKTILLSLLASTIGDTDLIPLPSSQFVQLLQFRVPLPSSPEEWSLALDK